MSKDLTKPDDLDGLFNNVITDLRKLSIVIIAVGFFAVAGSASAQAHEGGETHALKAKIELLAQRPVAAAEGVENKQNVKPPVVVSERLQKQMDDFKLSNDMKKEMVDGESDDYEWRWASATTREGGIPTAIDWVQWAYKKNGLPITNSAGEDTTYTMTYGDEDYLCGVYADTVDVDGGDTWVVNYRYRQGETIADLQDRWEGISPMNTLAFHCWDSTATRWVEVEYKRFIPPLSRMVSYWEVTDDSVYANAPVTVYPRPLPDSYEKSYAVDHTPYYLSIPLSIHEADNRAELLDMTIYPNPGNVGFSISTPVGCTAIEIHDLTGRKVAELNPIDPFWQPAQSVESGVYLITAITPKGRITRPAVLVK